MGTTADKLNAILNSKENIKQAIIEKGVSDIGDVLSTYPDKIREIGGDNGIKLPGDYPLIGDLTYLDINDFIESFVSERDFNQLISMDNSFDGCIRITKIVLPELPSVTTMNYCFAKCYSLSSIQLSGLSKLENMNFTFYQCKNLKTISLPELPRVVSMDHCFSNCRHLYDMNLSGLSMLTNMDQCFNNCRDILEINLPPLSSIQTMYSCFNKCESLQILNIDSIGQSISTLSNWGISSCTSLKKQSLLNIINALPQSIEGNTCSIGTTNLSKLSSSDIQVATDKGWTLV